MQQQGKRRTLGFVRQRGDEYVQTIVDLDHPDDAAHPYAENMAAPFLAVAEPRRLLMIGLGGGSLVRMFHSRLPAAVLAQHGDNGTYYDESRPARPNPQALDPDLQSRLHEATDRLIRGFAPTPDSEVAS